MAKATLITRPAGQSADYRFFRGETGKTFKAKNELGENEAKQPTVAISVSQVDAAGKAIVDEGGFVDIVYHTHVFTDEELKDPKFDPDARLAEMMDKVVTDQEAIINNKSKLKALVSNWSK